MIFTKALAIKGFAGIVGCAGFTYAGIGIYNLIKDNTETKQLLAKVGLSCNSNNECSILTGQSLKVKQDQTTFEVSSIPSGSGKIKLHKLSGDSTDYHKGLKLVIEGGNIADNTNTLEEFETYEIKEENNKWNLTRKTKAIEEKKKILGLPDGESCDLPTDTSTIKSCSNIDAAKLKTINFHGKGEGEVNIPDNGTVTLKISKKTDAETYPNGGYKFVLETDKDITIPTSISIKKGTNTEFKIKKEGMVLSLERAWTVDSLAKKALIKGCTTAGSDKECTLGEKINAIIDSTSKEYSIEENSRSQKIKFEENVAEYNQGFKFTVESEISLGDSKQLGSGDYEIKEQNNKWYLSKKSN